MKTLTSAIACVLVLVGSLSISAKEPEENTSESDLATNDELSAEEAASVDARDREDLLRAVERARQAHEEVAQAQERAEKADREARELQEWHEGLVRRTEEANTQWKVVLDKLKSSREHMYEVSRVAPLVAASQPSIDLLRNDLAVSLRNRVATTTGGFVGIRMGESTPQGIVIDEVIENSPADEGGLLEGDLVSSIDGIDIRNAKNPTQALAALIQAVDPGTEVELSIVRGKKELAVPVEVGPISVTVRSRDPSTWTAYSLSPQDNYRSVVSILGYDRELVLLEFEDELGHYFGMEFGILVVDTPKDSPLQVGDLITRIDDKPVRSISHAQRFLRSAEETTEFTVKRRGKTQKLDIASSGLRISDVREL